MNIAVDGSDATKVTLTLPSGEFDAMRLTELTLGADVITDLAGNAFAGSTGEFDEGLTFNT